MQRHRCLLLLLSILNLPLEAHELQGHQGPTYEITEPIRIQEGQNYLKLCALEQETGLPTSARFSLVVDGKEFIPEALGAGGLRFVSIHTGKKQKFVALYARGLGEVEVLLPPGSQSGTVRLAKGLEYLPAEVPFKVSGVTTTVTAKLHRWTDIRSKGWLPAEEHLHYDRTEPAYNKDWLTILAGDDLAYGHFLVLKGGNLPGIWASQYAYGEQGQASDGLRLICPGEEYRDSMQGHINLLGIREVIPPILAGTPEHPYHYPAFYDVLQRARDLGGLVGPAHGTALGRSPSGIADTILSAVDFFEIANTHLYKTDVWYRLMNCGYIVPPAAGTDLPNYPFRDSWQPLLGEVRTYVCTGGKTDYESFKQAIKSGQVFVSSGPMIEISVDGVGPGGAVRLPKDGGEVHVTAKISGPRPLAAFELICNSEPLNVKISKTKDGPIYRWTIDQQVRIEQSSWLAARGDGIEKQALEKHTGILQHTMAHTGAVCVLVSGKPIRSGPDAKFLIRHLRDQIEFYRDGAKYAKPEDRDRALGLFQSAIAELERQLD